MRLSSFFNQAIEFGRESDPRGRKGAKNFEDSRLLYGDPKAEVRKIMVGIDIEVADLLLADRLRQKEGLDLVVGHHPEGRALAGLHEVMRLQADVLAGFGIPRRLAQELVDARMREVERRILPGNLMRAVDAAQLLNLPFICLHTPADNHVYRFLQGLFIEKKPRTVSDIVDILMGVPEYRAAAQDSLGPRVILGSPKRQAGKIMLEMTGGTEGPKDVFERLYKAGVRTLVSMHLSEEHLKKVKDADLNVVIAGHISSDTLGLNLLLDKIERKSKESFRVINCSGFRRVKRH